MLKQAVRFAAASGASALLSLGIPIVLREGFGVPANTAVAVGFVTVFCVNFFTSRRIVFRSSGGSRADFARFCIASAAFRGAEYGAFLILNDVLRVPYVAALVGILGVSAVTKFFVFRRYVYPAATRA